MSTTGGGRSFTERFDWAEYSALGLNADVSTLFKFGHNPSIGATEEDIWSTGGSLSYLSSAETLDVVSADAADAAAGTGARTVEIQGLDNAYLEISETVTLAGLSSVETTNSYLRVHRMIVRTAGSGEANAGIITATASTAATVQGQIDAGENQTLQVLYTVPANKTLLLTEVEASTPSVDDAEIRLRIRPLGEVFQTKYLVHINANSAVVPFKVLYKIDEKTDVKLTGKRVGGNDVDCSAYMAGLVVNSDTLT
jgi:hypothetical protein